MSALPRPLVVRCGAFGDVVVLTPLLRLLAARYRAPVDVIGTGAWTPPLLADEPSLGHLQILTSRKTPYLLCPSQWSLVRWLRGRGRGPVYLCDTDADIRRLLLRGGVHADDLVERDPDDMAVPMLWPDRWLMFGQRDAAAGYPTVPVDPARFRLPRLIVPEASRAALSSWRRDRGLEGSLVLFQPGNKRTHKRGTTMTADHPKHWDPERWAAVAGAVLADLPDAQVLLCGSPPEHGVLDAIHAATGRHGRVHNLARTLPVPRLLALLEQARSMVSVDTGPAHAAAALGCPLVVLFGPAPVEKWRPIGPGPVAVLGGERGERSRVADIEAPHVIAAWRALQRPFAQDAPVPAP